MQGNDFHAFKITLAFVVIPLFLIKKTFFVINLQFNCNAPLLNTNNTDTCPLLKLLCPSVLSHSNKERGLMYYSDGIIVFTVWRTSAGYICHLFLMRLCFIFSFLITAGNESPQDSSVLLGVYTTPFSQTVRRSSRRRLWKREKNLPGRWNENIFVTRCCWAIQATILVSLENNVTG